MFGSLCFAIYIPFRYVCVCFFLKSKFIVYIRCVFSRFQHVGSYTNTFHPIIDKIAASLGYRQLQYAVVIDAGSTGSRVLAYEFHVGYLNNRLVLDKELFHEIKPGLSFYHDKPAEVCV